MFQLGELWGPTTYASDVHDVEAADSNIDDDPWQNLVSYAGRNCAAFTPNPDYTTNQQATR